MIRKGTTEDLAQIEVFDEFGGDRELEILQKRLQVYLKNNQIVGYISTIDKSCLCGHPYISFLCVHPAYRSQVIASALLLEIERKYSNQKLFISTESNNLIMLNLIKKRNYILAGSLSGLNHDNSDEIYFYIEKEK
jgi:ribosomal protein S18 acetylase RimI-like enzyme